MSQQSQTQETLTSQTEDPGLKEVFDWGIKNQKFLFPISLFAIFLLHYLMNTMNQETILVSKLTQIQRFWDQNLQNPNCGPDEETTENIIGMKIFGWKCIKREFEKEGHYR